MSAFLVNKAHIDAIINFCIHHRLYFYHKGERYDFTEQGAELGGILWQANRKSVNVRYHEDDITPDYFVERGEIHTPVQILKALDCLVYQSCEYSEFDESFAYRIIQAIRSEAISRLPGYDDAQWEIVQPEPVKQTFVPIRATLITPKRIVEEDEPEEITAVLGQNPDPTGWYRNAISKPVEKPVKPATPFTESDPVMPKPRKGKGIINISGITSKSRTRYGQTYGGQTDTDKNADIVKNKSIRIYGLKRGLVRWDAENQRSVHYATAFDLTFKVGDTAVYGSFNLIYTGEIIAIGAKTVKICAHGKNHVLDLDTFIYRNWDYDADKIHKRNSEWYD